MTDASGAVVWAADYKPFGEATIAQGSSITNNLRFPGQYFDAETGLNYNLNRTYNTTLGRYIEKDPIGLRGGINPYVYTDNNPVNFTDPDGLCPSILDFGWTYSTIGPNKATDYQYQRQTKDGKVGRLTYASGKCDCQNKTLQCNYDVFESWHSRTRSYNRSTRQYGTWSAWDADPQIPGYDNRFVGAVIIEYNCKDQTYRLHGGMTF